MNDNIDKNEIRKAIDRLQTEHPCHFAFDATRFDSTDSVDVVKRAIDNIMEQIRDDADIHIISEMAKLYLDGVKPTLDRPHGEWIIRGDNTFITCNKCGYVKGVNCIYFRTRFEPLPNFCEMCGAAMVVQR